MAVGEWEPDRARPRPILGQRDSPPTQPKQARGQTFPPPSKLKQEGVAEPGGWNRPATATEEQGALHPRLGGLRVCKPL